MNRPPRASTRLLLAALLATSCAVPSSDRPTAGSTELEAELETALALIEPDMIRGHLQFLSDDLLRGRDTGDVGYELATRYVAAQFARIGLQPIDGASYLQPVELLEAGEDHGSRLEVSGLRFGNADAVFMPDWTGDRPEITGPGVFVGYGLPVEGRDDYGELDVEGAVVFVLSGSPAGWTEDPDRFHYTRLQAEIAYRRGAAAVVQIPTTANTAQAQAGFERRLASPRPVRALADGTAASFRAEVTLGPAAAERLWEAWGLTRDEAIELSEAGTAARTVGGTAGPVTLVRDREVRPGRSWNVMGVLPGSDPAVADEIVLMTSHLDHVGIGEPDEDGDAIYNGAHDNAVGVAKTLAAAEALATLSPRRSIGFLALGAEEGGLLGSWHYVRNSVVPIDNTVAAINQDGGLAAAPPTDDVVAFGDQMSADLRQALAQAAEDNGMRYVVEQTDPFGPSQMLLFRSDHYSFLLAGVPALSPMPGFTIAGDPEAGREQWRDYLARINHRQRDNYDPAWKLESPVNMATLAARLAWDLANAAGMPAMDADAPMSRARRSPEQPWFLGDGSPQPDRPQAPN